MCLFLALAIGYLATRSPWWDEGLFADVALNFRNFGYLGSSALDPNGYLRWPEAHRYTYWQFPMYLIALGTWFRLIPPTVEGMRALSLICSCLYLTSWFVIIRVLSRNESLALFVTCVVALDYTFIGAASDGRMEMMCVALGYAGDASYLYFRDRRWLLGIGLAALFGAASLFCHPMGLVTNACIAALVLIDSRRIQRHIWIALIPYVGGAALYARYIFEAPRIFEAQYHSATAYRERTIFALTKSIFTDAYQRYWQNFFTLQAGVNKIRVLILIFSVSGVVVLAMNKKLRSEPLGRTLLLLAAISYIGVAVLDNQGFPFYMVYSLPAMTACGAIWVYAQWQRKGFARFIPASLLAVSVFVVIAGYSLKIARNDYKTLYKPAVMVATNEVHKPGGVIMGGSELGFSLGFRSGLIDDRYLGYFSGLTPDVYVQSRYYYPMPSPELSHAWEASRQKLRTQFHLVFENTDYRVYALKDNVRHELMAKR